MEQQLLATVVRERQAVVESVKNADYEQVSAVYDKLIKTVVSVLAKVQSSLGEELKSLKAEIEKEKLSALKAKR